jgi:hypothetical protein
MTQRCVAWLAALAASVLVWNSSAQIPVEVFVGQQRSTLDIMFFTYFKTREHQSTPWLFFNRNRAGVDYRMTQEDYLPQFGFTEAISYNPSAWKGLAPVAVVQILNAGVYPKGGFQFAHNSKTWTVFTWLVSEVQSNPNLDLFGLVRYTPRLSKSLDGFIQLESVNSLPTQPSTRNFNLIQRFRLGIQMGYFQWGLGADLAQYGPQLKNQTAQWGVFTRYVFKS